MSGAKYSTSALPDIWRVPVNASSASGHGFDAPIASIALSFCADFLVAVEAAAVQRPLPAGLVARRLVELELQDPREEVARVGRVAGMWIFGARIEGVAPAAATGGTMPW